MTLNVGLVVQKRIFEILSADAALDALLGDNKIFDFVPQDAAYPYVKIGIASYNDLESTTTSGFTGDIQIDVWTGEPDIGTAKGHEIMTRIRDLLHNTDIWDITDLENYCMINFREVFRQVVAEPDSATYHGVMRFDMTLGGNTSL